MESFGKDLTLEEALNCMDDVPSQLYHHEAIKNLRVKAVKILGDRLEDMEREIRGQKEEDEDEDKREQMRS